MKLARSLLVFFGCAALVGCMHTVIGGNPVRSPDQRCRLGVVIHGASARSYVALTRKRVYLWLGANTDIKPATYFSKKYVFTAADLDWHVQWRNSDEVVVDFYDYGDGVLASRMRGMASNHVATLTFQWDQQTEKFVERK